MNKFLLLSFVFLFCFFQAEALFCHVCEFGENSRDCIKKQRNCIPQAGYHCKYYKLYIGGKKVEERKGCSHPGDRCNVVMTGKQTVEVTWCCNHHDFCI